MPPLLAGHGGQLLGAGLGFDGVEAAKRGASRKQIPISISWQQASAVAVARRLLVVSAALVLVWQLGRAESPAGAELRTVLVRLSGRQMKWGCAWTAPALLEGVWVLLAMLELLEHHDLPRLRQLAETFFHPPEKNDFNLCRYQWLKPGVNERSKTLPKN